MLSAIYRVFPLDGSTQGCTRCQQGYIQRVLNIGDMLIPDSKILERISHGSMSNMKTNNEHSVNDPRLLQSIRMGTHKGFLIMEPVWREYQKLPEVYLYTVSPA